MKRLATNNIPDPMRSTIMKDSLGTFCVLTIKLPIHIAAWETHWSGESRPPFFKPDLRCNSILQTGHNNHDRVPHILLETYAQAALSVQKLFHPLFAKLALTHLPGCPLWGPCWFPEQNQFCPFWLTEPCSFPLNFYRICNFTKLCTVILPRRSTLWKESLQVSLL